MDQEEIINDLEGGFFLKKQKSKCDDSVHPPPPFCWAGGSWASYQIFKEEGDALTRSQFLERVARKEGGDFFRGVQLLHKK